MKNIRLFGNTREVNGKVLPGDLLFDHKRKGILVVLKILKNKKFRTRLCETFGEKGAAEFGRQVVLTCIFHDFGKAFDEFAGKIRSRIQSERVGAKKEAFRHEYISLMLMLYLIARLDKVDKLSDSLSLLRDDLISATISVMRHHNKRPQLVLSSVNKGRVQSDIAQVVSEIEQAIDLNLSSELFSAKPQQRFSIDISRALGLGAKPGNTNRSKTLSIDEQTQAYVGREMLAMVDEFLCPVMKGTEYRDFIAAGIKGFFGVKPGDKEASNIAWSDLFSSNQRRANQDRSKLLALFKSQLSKFIPLYIDNQDTKWLNQPEKSVAWAVLSKATFKYADELASSEQSKEIKSDDEKLGRYFDEAIDRQLFSDNSDLFLGDDAKKILEGCLPARAVQHEAMSIDPNKRLTFIVEGTAGGKTAAGQLVAHRYGSTFYSLHCPLTILATDQARKMAESNSCEQSLYTGGGGRLTRVDQLKYLPEAGYFCHTYDQLYKTIIGEKREFLFLRLFIGGTVCLDELDAVSGPLEWSNTLFMISILGAAKIPLVVLSATISEEAIRVVNLAYNGPRSVFAVSSCNYIDCGESSPLFGKCAIVNESHQGRYKIVSYTDKSQFDELVESCSKKQGARVGIYVNNVDTAVGLYKYLKGKNTPVAGVNIDLYHGKLSEETKDNVKDSILALYGKKGSADKHKEKRILILTQVGEVGLDLGFSDIITEPAPVQETLQRGGRVNRHGLYEGSCVYILTSPIFGYKAAKGKGLRLPPVVTGWQGGPISFEPYSLGNARIFSSLVRSLSLLDGHSINRARLIASKDDNKDSHQLLVTKLKRLMELYFRFRVGGYCPKWHEKISGEILAAATIEEIPESPKCWHIDDYGKNNKLTYLLNLCALQTTYSISRRQDVVRTINFREIDSVEFISDVSGHHYRLSAYLCQDNNLNAQYIESTSKGVYKKVTDELF